jgi:hypothetical protein
MSDNQEARAAIRDFLRPRASEQQMTTPGGYSPRVTVTTGSTSRPPGCLVEPNANARGGVLEERAV